MALHQARVGRHAVALGQQHQVAAHHVAAGQALRPAVAQQQGARAGQVAQGVKHAFGAVFLQQGDADHHQHEGQQTEGYEQNRDEAAQGEIGIGIEVHDETSPCGRKAGSLRWGCRSRLGRRRFAALTIRSTGAEFP
jgi:hypothetical protein